jgi:hypothetical protein
MPNQINFTPWDEATLLASEFIKVEVIPMPGYEPFFDYKDYVIRKSDVVEIRRNREDNKCIIFMDSGIVHDVDYQPNDPQNPILVSVGGVNPTSNENLRDLLMGALKPQYV